MTDSETDELTEQLFRRNYVSIAGNHSEKHIELVSPMEARAAQLVLMRPQRDVTIRFIRKSNGWSIRPGADDRIECRHGNLDGEQEASAQRLADEAITNGLLEVEREADMFEQESTPPADPWKEKQQPPF